MTKEEDLEQLVKSLTYINNHLKRENDKLHIENEELRKANKIFHTEESLGEAQGKLFEEIMVFLNVKFKELGYEPKDSRNI